MEIQVLQDLSAISRKAANLFAKLVRQADRNRFSVALSGGSTPKGLYQLLADENEPYRSEINWQNVHFFWSDERCVPPDSSESNFRTAYQSLLAPLFISPMNYCRLKGELEPAEAALEYEKILRLYFNLSADENAIPNFDLIFLGMGADGHTASIFPGSAVTGKENALVAAPFVEKFAVHRLTLTPRVINNAANVVVLVSGADKAKTLRTVLEGEYQPEKYPSQIIKPSNGNLLWLVDEAAARKLSPRLTKALVSTQVIDI